MARIDSKQLNPALTGSFTLSGSFTGDSSSTGSFGQIVVGGGKFTSASLAAGGAGQGFPFTGSAGIQGDLSVTGDISTVATASFGKSVISGKLQLAEFGDVSASLAAAVAGGDNLGNHTATQDINVGGYNIKGVTHISASGNYSGSAASTGSFGILEANKINVDGPITGSGGKIKGTLDVHDDVLVGEYISHRNDANTRIYFTDDRLRFQAGGLDFVGMHKKDSAPHLVTINNGSNNIDFQVKDNDNNILIRTDADAQLVKFPDALLISGSHLSTGSFGQLVVHDDIELVEDQRIYFEADKETWIESHASDSFRIVAGSNQMLLLDYDTGNRAVFGNGTKVYIGADNTKLPDKELVVDGDISGSAASTGSFGTVQVAGKTFTTAVSESAAASGFGAGSGGGDGSGTGIFAATGSDMSTTNNLQMSGSVKVSGSQQATSIFANNIQNGYPTSNNWGESLDGSYFNNFDNTTHVSEILRFIAGAMSHSLDVSDAAPNTKTYGSVTATHTDGSETSKSTLLNGVLGSTYENARLSSAWTGSAFIDMSETGSYKQALDYLEAKGWVVSGDRGTNNDDVGTNPFHGSYASRIPSSNITTQATFGTFSHTLAANAAGSTAVSSNGNYFGLGGLNSGAASAFKVRVIATQSFSDNYSDSTPDENSTFSRSGSVDYTTTSFGTSGDGLILSKIVTSQPAVIPSAFQDGDFSVAGAFTGRQYTGGATSATNISASGYYAYHGVRAGIATGSQSTFTFKNGSDSSTRFYLYTGGITTDISDGAPTAVVSTTLERTGFTATSRSLSGAPYLLTTTYAYSFDSEVSKSFDPGFGYASSVLVNTNSTDTWDNVGATSLSNATTTVNNSGVSSTGATNFVIDSTKTTKRTSGQSPNISDIAVASSSFTFSLDSNSTNVGQNRTSNNTLNYNLAFRATGRNWKNSSVTDTSSTINFYTASLFNQSADSGSMAIYSRAQGYDANTLQDTTETFVGEDFRVQLTNNVTSFTAPYFVSGTYRTNDAGHAVLGDYDLQVKPGSSQGYLVDPGGDYGYWFPEDFGSGTYKYYVRKFQKSSGTKTSMTVNLSSKTLVNWNSTSDGIACVLVFESGTSAGNQGITTCRFYDPSATVSNLIESAVSNDNHKNPFSSNIDLYGNTGGSVSSGTYTVPIRNADGMVLDSNNDELYVIIRYKGDPAPVRQITLAYS